MRREVQRYLDERPEERLFVRLHPEWYRKLSRSPQDLAGLKREADFFFGRTFGQRLDRLNSQANMLLLMMSVAQAMGAENEKKAGPGGGSEAADPA
ncbi:MULTISPECIES: YlbE-like family protein [unclassified Sporolactobacillus]|uniref:YlbE-like family protein n=1 Tax=unclassified Sporolactobacillus TaxID=2628533 RepID=UPI0023685DE5|nr:YlbE-like family protein [Sporolactobacillus sp. CQH2019]MDD9147176.1 YlbE-like family protein [Sporolactobacillus sp. CQH2019]